MTTAAPAADPAAAPAASAAPASPAAAPAPAAAAPAAPAADPANPATPKAGDPAAQPATYEAFKLPEGVKLNEAVMGEFSTLAKSLNLNQADAQKLVDLGAKMQQGAETAIAETVNTAKAEWETASKADKEIGGEQFPENLAKANKVFADYGTPELKQLLVDSGLGNHPELLRWAFRVGKALSEDKIVRADRAAANAGGTLEERAAAKLYPNQKTGT